MSLDWCSDIREDRLYRRGAPMLRLLAVEVSLPTVGSSPIRATASQLMYYSDGIASIEVLNAARAVPPIE